MNNRDEVHRMQPLKLMDYHLHTGVTIDGKMTEAEACERALSMGIHEIAFTNHIMLTQPDHTISPNSLLVHRKRIQACRERFPELTIRIGIEMDFYPGRESEIAATLDHYAQLIGGSFDLVLGSVHDVGGHFFSNKNQAPALFKDRDITQLYNDYFELAAQAAQSQLFDVIAHPDLIKKYTHHLTSYVPYEQYTSSAERFIDALINSGVGLEVNTKGLRLPVNETYPSTQLLAAYLAIAKLVGVDPIVTLGSDAHKVEDVGFSIREISLVLSDLGLFSLTRFEKRLKSRFVL